MFINFISSLYRKNEVIHYCVGIEVLLDVAFSMKAEFRGQVDFCMAVEFFLWKGRVAVYGRGFLCGGRLLCGSGVVCFHVEEGFCVPVEFNVEIEFFGSGVCLSVRVEFNVEVEFYVDAEFCTELRL